MLTCIHAVVCSDGGHIEEAEREGWTERFLTLLCSPGGGKNALRHAASTALAGQ